MTEGIKAVNKLRASSRWPKVMASNAPAMHKDLAALVAAARRRKKLSDKMTHLVWVAVDTVVTHLYQSGAVLHAEEALASGASVAEVMDTLRLASIPTTRGLQNGYALLAAAKPGLANGAGETADWQQLAAQMSPEYLQAYRKLIDSPLPGGLDERDRALVTLGVHCNPAIADKEATDRAIRHALGLGIDPEEIMETMEVASLIGIHAFSLTLDGLSEAFEKYSGNAAKAAQG